MQHDKDSARPVRLLVLDVDGVLSDGGITYGSGGLEIKKFYVRDGLGIFLAKLAGIKIAVITVRESEAVGRRCGELKVDYLCQGTSDKWKALSGIIDEMGIAASEVAYVGDDLVDIPVMRKIGFPVAVADAVGEVKALARYVTAMAGGRGAVRDAVEHILKGEERWDMTLEKYFDQIRSSDDGTTCMGG